MHLVYEMLLRRHTLCEAIAKEASKCNSTIAPKLALLNKDVDSKLWLKVYGLRLLLTS